MLLQTAAFSSCHFPAGFCYKISSLYLKYGIWEEGATQKGCCMHGRTSILSSWLLTQGNKATPVMKDCFSLLHQALVKCYPGYHDSCRVVRLSHVEVRSGSLDVLIRQTH